MACHPTFSFWGLLLTITQVQAWTYSTNINVTSPPPINTGYLYKDGVSLVDRGPSAFPCGSIPVPDNVSRTPFPIQGGRLSYSMANTSDESLNDYWYMATIYLGQIKLDNGSYSVAQQSPGGMNYGYWGASTEPRRSLSTGQGCSRRTDALTLIGQALRREDITAEEVEGMEATFGTSIVLFAPGSTKEVMYFCGYVTFTSEDLEHNPDAGYCNSDPLRDSDPDSTLVATGTSVSFPTTVTPTPTVVTLTQTWGTVSPSPTGTDVIYTSPTESPIARPVNRLAVGLGVGISVGVAVILLAVGWIWMRRRKARKNKGTIGVDVMITRPMEGDDVKSAVSEKKDNKAMAKSGDSIHSQPEPLPVYTKEKQEDN